MAEGSSTKRPRFTSNIVTVRVGADPAPVDFFVHKDTLTKHSDFFKTALDKKWKEGQSLVVELPEDEEGTFSEYVNWLYEGKLGLGVTGDGEIPWQSYVDLDDTLAKLYVFGEKILDAKFCNVVVRGFVANIEAYLAAGFPFCMPGPSTIKIVYKGTSRVSPVRQFLVDLYLNEQLKWYEEDEEEGGEGGRESPYDPEFDGDLIVALLNQRRAGNVAKYVEPGLLPSEAWFKPE